jgi:hypothetical protein
VDRTWCPGVHIVGRVFWCDPVARQAEQATKAADGDDGRDLNTAGNLLVSSILWQAMEPDIFRRREGGILSAIITRVLPPANDAPAGDGGTLRR